MKKIFPCILCPNGCEIEAEVEDGQMITCEGAGCPRGQEYAKQELIAPMRTFSSSVCVLHGNLPLVSVRLDKPVPKQRIFDVMEVIRSVCLEAPVSIGDVVIDRVAGLDVRVIATKNISRI